MPLIVVSPYARPAYGSHQQHEFGSILHFIEDIWGLGTLGYSDSRADDLSDCFNFSQTPIRFQTIQSTRRAAAFMNQPPTNVSPDNDF